VSPNLVCFNCSKKGDHYTRDCKEPPVGCEYCGDKAFHKSEYCFVPNDKPLPVAWKPERKQEMELKRKQYKEKMKAAKSAEAIVAVTEPSLTQLRALAEGNLSII
jgi:DNA-directed RNA polymerase subunit RPC12/RpoP